jgi:hypothetical protein
MPQLKDLRRSLITLRLQLKGWWPYFLAVVDASLAAGVIALLAITMMLGVQTFDQLAVHGGGNRILPLGRLFDRLAASPYAPEYWWLYALLLSTMIPSLINLMIGGASLLGGVPGLSPLLLRFLPIGKAVPIRTLVDCACANVSGFHRRRPGDCGAGVSVYWRHLLRHAVIWPRAARHGARCRHLRSAGTLAAVPMGQPVAPTTEATRRSWAVMNRYFEYIKCGKRPLDNTAYPVLKRFGRVKRRSWVLIEQPRPKQLLPSNHSSA